MTTHELGELLMASDNVDVCIPVPGYESAVQEVLKFTVVGDDFKVPGARFILLEGEEKVMLRKSEEQPLIWQRLSSL